MVQQETPDVLLQPSAATTAIQHLLEMKPDAIWTHAQFAPREEPVRKTAEGRPVVAEVRREETCQSPAAVLLAFRVAPQEVQIVLKS